MTNTLDGTISRIDPRRGVATTFPIGPGDGPAGVTADAHNVWVSNEFGGTVVRIDPQRGTVLKRFTVGNRPQGLALVKGALWVGVAASGAHHRGGTLRTLTDLHFNTASFDPALSDGPVTYQLFSIANDGLVAFRRGGASPGWTLVPDLAVSLPAPTDGGRTYRFRLRSGIRYSTGALVRPADIRRELERSFHGGSTSLGSANFTAIAGAPACVSRPAACDLSRGIVIDDAADTIPSTLTVPDPDFLDKLALPSAVAVPATAAAVPQHRALPATGPYVIASSGPRPVHPARAQPALPRVVKRGETRRLPRRDHRRRRDQPERSGTRRRAWNGGLRVPGGTDRPGQRTQRACTRFAGQIHSNPLPGLVAFFLNTRTAPFDNIDARKAVNYAVDRRAAAAVTSGAGAAAPTCQILPPNFPGYRRYCPYTADPGPGRAWRAPDLERARRLIARSNTRGMHVKVWAPLPGLTTRRASYVPLLDKLLAIARR